MPERNTIQSSGFANTGPLGARTGFQLRLRQPNYRGLRLSLVEGIDIEIDGQAYPAEHNHIRLDGADYTPADMAEATDIRWTIGTCLSVIVPWPGGLEPGVHDVAVTLRLRHPYFPPRFQPALVRDRRHITIVL